MTPTPDTALPPTLAEIIHDLRGLHAQTSPGQWAKGQTTHHTVALRKDQPPYRIAEFHHADDAAFCDFAHQFIPRLLDELEAYRAASLKGEAAYGTEQYMRGFNDAKAQFDAARSAAPRGALTEERLGIESMTPEAQRARVLLKSALQKRILAKPPTGGVSAAADRYCRAVHTAWCAMRWDVINALKELDFDPGVHCEVDVSEVTAPSVPVQQGREPLSEERRHCAMCGGRGFYGSPGARCDLCKGTGKGIFSAIEAAHGIASSPSASPAGSDGDGVAKITADKAPPRMDIYSSPGTKVIFDARGGYPSEQEAAKKMLTLGNGYTVKSIDIHTAHSYVELAGFKGSFNTTMFAASAQPGAGDAATRGTGE